MIKKAFTGHVEMLVLEKAEATATCAEADKLESRAVALAESGLLASWRVKSLIMRLVLQSSRERLLGESQLWAAMSDQLELTGKKQDKSKI